MNTRSPYIAHLHLKAGARNKTEPTVVHVAPIQRKAIPAWLWVVTLVPWVFVACEVIA